MLFKTPEDSRGSQIMKLYVFDEESDIWIEVSNGITDYIGELEYACGDIDDKFKLKYMSNVTETEMSKNIVPVERELINYIRTMAEFQVGNKNKQTVTDSEILSHIELSKIQLLSDVALYAEGEGFTLTRSEGDVFTIPVSYLLDSNFGGVVSNADIYIYSYDEETRRRTVYTFTEYDAQRNELVIPDVPDDATLYFNAWYSDKRPEILLYRLGLVYLIATNALVSRMGADTQTFTTSDGREMSLPLGANMKVGPISISGGNPFQVSSAMNTTLGRLENLYNKNVKYKLFNDRLEIVKDPSIYRTNVFGTRDFA